MKKIFIILFLIIFPLTSHAFDYYTVDGTKCPGANCWQPTNSQSYPAWMGSYTDVYGMTITRMTNESGIVKPAYASRTTTIENSDGSLIAVYSEARCTYANNYPAFSIFTTADGIFRCHVGEHTNNAAYVSYDNFMWSNTSPYVAYFFAQSRSGDYDNQPAKFWKITINPATWNITWTLLYTFARGDMPTCPGSETLWSVRHHDEAPDSWDSRYWSILFRCTGDTDENSSYALMLFDRDLGGSEVSGIKGYVIMPNRDVRTSGVSPSGNYMYWREYGTSGCGEEMSCVKFFPVSSISGNTTYSNFTKFTNHPGMGGHYNLGYDDLGNEIYVTLSGSGETDYDYGYYKFNSPTSTPVTTYPWPWQRSTHYGPGHGNGHSLIAGINSGNNMWSAYVDADGGYECGYEGTLGSATTTFFRNSATNQKVFRVAHQRSNAFNYENQSSAGISRDGTKFYFSSNWCNTETQQLFRVTLPSTWWTEIMGEGGGTIKTLGSGTVKGGTIK